MNYKIGQKLICIGNIIWVLDDGSQEIPGPGLHDIVTVSGNDKFGVLLEEYPMVNEGYEIKWFRPLNSSLKTISYKKVIEQESELILEN